MAETTIFVASDCDVPALHVGIGAIGTASPLVAANAAGGSATASTADAGAGVATQSSASADTAVVDYGARDVAVAQRDPLQKFNRRMFAIHQGVDRALIRPLGLGYQHIVPKPARDGFRNVIRNLTEPIVFLNYLLQFKIGKAFRTVARFTVNSVGGVGGLFDVAKRPDVNLPYHANGFADTLAYYGVRSGPYLFLPFIGPTTLRDVLSNPVDGAVLPVAIGNPFDKLEFQLSTGFVSGLDQRAEADADLKALLGSAVDPYATLRSAYLQSRAAEIRDIKGRPGNSVVPEAAVTPELDDPLTDPAAGDPAVQPPAAQSDTPELLDPLADPAAQPGTSAPDAPNSSPKP